MNYDKGNKGHYVMLLLDIAQCSATEIASFISQSVEDVCTIQRSELYKNARADVEARLDGQALAPEAPREETRDYRKVMHDLANGRKPQGVTGDVTPHVVLSATRELLDRDEPKLNKVQEDRHIHLSLPPEMTARFKEALLAAEDESRLRNTVDVTPSVPLERYMEESADVDDTST